MSIIAITKKKQEQFNRMYEALKEISENYYPVNVLQSISESKYGVEPDEAVEMAYENMQDEAKRAIRGIKPFKQ